MFTTVTLHVFTVCSLTPYSEMMGVELALGKDGRLKVHHCVCQSTTSLPEHRLLGVFPNASNLDQMEVATVIHQARSNLAW